MLALHGCDCWDSHSPGTSDSGAAFDAEAPVDARAAEAGPEDAGPPDAWAGCADDPFEQAPPCAGQTGDCPPQRPYCCGISREDGYIAYCYGQEQPEYEAGFGCGLSREPGCPPPEPCVDDADGDGFAASSCGGSDCDDSDPAVNPDAGDDFEGDRWVVSPAFPDGGYMEVTGLTTDAAGDVAIAMSAEGVDLDRIEWGVLRDGAWEVTVIDEGSVAGPSVARSEDGRIAIAYRWRPPPSTQGADELRVATPEGEVSTAVVASPSGAYVAVAVGLIDQTYLAYQSFGELHVASRAEGEWIDEVVWTWMSDVAGFGSVAIAVDSTDAAHVAFNANGDIWYATNVSGDWVVTSLHTDLRDAGVAIAVDDQDHTNIVYERWTTADQAHATNESGDWLSQLLVHGQVSSRDDPGAAARGELVAVVADTVAAGPSVAWRSGGAWTLERPPGPYSSRAVAIGDDGEIHVAVVHRDDSIRVLTLEDLRRVDQNCDGADGVDEDADGYASEASGGADCDDTARQVSPDAEDPADDRIDQNCDGRP